MLRLLGRYIFREIFSSALLGTLLATFILFLRGVDPIFELLVKSTSSNTRLVLQLFALAIPARAAVHHSLRRAGRHPDRPGPARDRWRNHRHARRRRLQPQSDRARAPVRRPRHRRGGLRHPAPDAVFHPQTFTDIKNQLEATQLSADVTPRVFVENFPNTILYVGDVRPGRLAQHFRRRCRAARTAHQRHARQGRRGP